MLSVVGNKQKEIDQHIRKLNKTLNEYEKKSKKNLVSPSEVAGLQSNIGHLQTLVRAFEIETASISNRKQARKYRTKAREYAQFIKQAEKDAKWLAAHARGQESKHDSEGITADTIMKNEDTAIAYGRKLQLETENIADRAIQNLEETKIVAIDAADKVSQQTEQIERIDRNLAGIEDEMDRASRAMKRLGRRVMTDKYVAIILTLVIIAIAVIVVLQFVDIPSYVAKVRTAAPL